MLPVPPLSLRPAQFARSPVIRGGRSERCADALPSPGRSSPGRRSSGRRCVGRRGVVAVEFAMVLTLAFLFFFAAFEFCRVAMIRHTVDNAVYEAARRGIIPGGDAVSVADTARRILTAVGVRDATVTVQPSTITRTTEHVTVSVRVPLDTNSYVPANFFRGKVIDRSLTMRREGT